MHARYAVVAIVSLLTVFGVFAAGASAEEKERTSCRTADRFGEFSDWSEPINLGPVVNSEFNDRHPAISPNGLSLYITSDRPGGFGPEGTWNIWVSQRASLHDPWGPPRNLGPSINTPGGFAPNISPDGHWLFFAGGPPFGGSPSPGDIWVSHRKDTDDDFAWEPAMDLGPEINDLPRFDSNAPTFFRDEETGITRIYFTSQFRRDGPGDFDIYVSTQREDADDRGFVGTFGPPVLVPELSSPRRDTRTAIRRDGLEMFITSNRAGSVPDPSGQLSLDLWVSTRASTNDPWSPPVNSGPTLNTPAAEGGPALSCDGTTLYFYSTRPGGAGKEDLYVTTRQILHVIAPQETDRAIDPAFGDHYAWLDPAIRSNHKLLVFMPGTATPPKAYQLVQREAARLGYHVIGLAYPNSVRLATACPPTADPNACFENARLEILDGIDRTSVVDVNQPNSIDNRLTKLLQYLGERYPEEGWSRFLTHGEPKWSRIAVSGHSQGGGEAAMIGKLRIVPRVVLFSAVPDTVAALGAPTWEMTHATPSERYWGLGHDRDPAFSAIRAGWDALGMDTFGPAVTPEASEPPYDLTHMLVTDLVPRGGSFSIAHGSTVGDNATPLDADGIPALRDAWRYLLTAKTGDDDDADESDEDEGDNSTGRSMPATERRH